MQSCQKRPIITKSLKATDYCKVANGDQHYSPASIAGFQYTNRSVAEGDEQIIEKMLLTFSERKFILTYSQRFSLGFNICHLR